MFNKVERLKRSVSCIDYGARFYDPSIGRLMSVDPLAATSNNNYMTPYHYVANNPISNIDPDGLDWYSNNETGETHWQEGSDDLDGYTNLGAEYTIYGDNQTIVHHQNEIVSITENNVESQSSKNSNKSVSGQIMSGALTAAAVTSQLDSPVPGPADLFAAGELVLGGIAAGLTYLTIDRVYSKKAQDGGKNESHGDSGRAMEKALEQKKQIEKQMIGATKKLKKKLKKKIERIIKDAQKKAKGENHHNNK